MITWNPNDKGINCELINDNYTVICFGNSYPTVRCTEPKNSGKWYFELTHNKSYKTGFGICNKECGLNQYLGYSDSLAYLQYEGQWWENNSSVKSTSFKIKDGDVHGILLDCDNKTVQSVVNGVLQDDKTNYKFNGDIYVTYGKTTSPTSDRFQATINFGKSPFYLYENNKELWYQIIELGYKPYDWNCFKYILKQDKIYYSIKSQFYDISTNKYLPCEKDYETNEIEDLGELIKDVNAIEKIGDKETIDDVTIFKFDISNYINKIEVI